MRVYRVSTIELNYAETEVCGGLQTCVCHVTDSPRDGGRQCKTAAADSCHGCNHG